MGIQSDWRICGAVPVGGNVDVYPKNRRIGSSASIGHGRRDDEILKYGYIESPSDKNN